MSWIHRSTNDGKEFHIVSANGTRPDGPPGGGDTDVAQDDQGTVYFTDLEGPLAELGTSVSHDNGNTFRKNPAAVQQTTVDRQWFAVDNGGTNAATDNSVFLAFHETAVGTFIYSSPGSTAENDPVGGLVWQNSASAPGPLQPLAGDAICAQLRFDPLKRNLYYACNFDDHVRITVGHVNAGQRTGITYTNYAGPKSPGGKLLNLFPSLAVDQAGNVYVAWIDSNDHNLYYAFSNDAARSWSAPVKVNTGPAVTNEFDWAQAGKPGTLVLAWYATDKSTPTGSDGMPSSLTDLGAATKFPWYGYATLVNAANTAAPQLGQTRFTEKPMHYGSICNSGTLCATTAPPVGGADRQMADFFGFSLTQSGALRIVYDDTTNEFDGAALLAARQISGKTPLGGSLHEAAPANPVSDQAGDAQYPHYSPAGAGPSLPQLDLTGVSLSNPNKTTLRVQMSAADLGQLVPPPGKATSVWLTRFQALAPRPGGSEDVYRIFYVGMEKTGPASPTFFAGTAACMNTTPQNCKVFQYPAGGTALGSVSGNTITIDVDIRNGFGVPIDDTRLYNVTGFSFGRSNSTTDIYADVDATASFDYTLRKK
jgi:hypothetical protein